MTSGGDNHLRAEFPPNSTPHVTRLLDLGLHIASGAYWEQSAERRGDEGSHLGALLVGVIGHPGPEEPSQAITLRPRDHVDMEMGNRLTHRVVGGHEGAAAAQGAGEGGGDAPDLGEERLHQRWRQVREGHVVGARHHQHVSLEDGAHVEESDRMRGDRHDVGRSFLGNDPAERAPATHVLTIADMADTPIHLSSGLPETVLPEPDPTLVDRLALAAASHDRDDVVALVASQPRLLEGWAALGDQARDVIEAYACYRVGYHRGLDALRANGWRGSGYVRGRHPGNMGFLRCVEGLRAAAESIGENDEAERCATFLRQLDPDWRI